MRYLIFFVLFCFPFLSYATDMCARDDTMVMVFDPDIKRTSGGSYGKATFVWNFPYGRIVGETTCLSATEGLGRTSSTGVPYYGVGDYDKTFISATAGLKGVDEKGNERKYCWCRTAYPLQSKWVFYSAYSSATDCAANCPDMWACAYNDQSLVVQYFNSIGL